VVMVHFIHADRVIARPLAVIQALAQSERPIMKRGSDRQGGSL
jgi:hypothetical protein